jgi:hypothetical protein
MAATVANDDIRRALAAADFPATKEQLLDAAADAGADQPVLDAVRALPVADYENVDEVLRSVETVDATAPPGQQGPGTAKRDHPHTGLAQHMRSEER